MKKIMAFIIVVACVVMVAGQSEAFFWGKEKKDTQLVQQQLNAQVAELQQSVESLKGELEATKQQLADANGMIGALNEKLAASEATVNEYKAKMSSETTEGAAVCTAEVSEAAAIE